MDGRGSLVLHEDTWHTRLLSVLGGCLLNLQQQLRLGSSICTQIKLQTFKYPRQVVRECLSSHEQGICAG